MGDNRSWSRCYTSLLTLGAKMEYFKKYINNADIKYKLTLLTITEIYWCHKTSPARRSRPWHGSQTPWVIAAFDLAATLLFDINIIGSWLHHNASVNYIILIRSTVDPSKIWSSLAVRYWGQKEISLARRSRPWSRSQIPWVTTALDLAATQISFLDKSAKMEKPLGVVYHIGQMCFMHV